MLELNREQATSLIDMLRAIDAIPIEGESTVHVDDQLLRDVFADPTAIASVYANDPAGFRALIESDAHADDVIALQHRRDVPSTMRHWLEDDDAFAEASAAAGGPERAWQQLLEANPWVMGVGLGGQLLTSWEEGKLEQTVVGRSIKGVGKRADALPKHRRHRPIFGVRGDQAPQGSAAGRRIPLGLVESVEGSRRCHVQSQQTVHLASRELGDYIHDQAGDGAFLGTGTFILQPRSYVIVGSLRQLTGASGLPIPDKVRSFELFRRNLHDPEVITFDELVARAEWHVEAAVQTSGAGERQEQDPDAT